MLYRTETKSQSLSLFSDSCNVNPILTYTVDTETCINKTAVHTVLDSLKGLLKKFSVIFPPLSCIYLALLYWHIHMPSLCHLNYLQILYSDDWLCLGSLLTLCTPRILTIGRKDYFWNFLVEPTSAFQLRKYKIWKENIEYLWRIFRNNIQVILSK